MDAYSSGEELVIKTRKPYTITKQRERWTEEEHNRFLEALKLYGRAWQRIEEHIGTKTAVQIRSHAQKFFSKLEKEALVNGVPIGQAIDIEIPPPRPKRKPSNPYPRKIGAASSLNTQVRVKDGKPVPSGSHLTDKVLDLEKQPFPVSIFDDLQKTAGDNGKQNAKKNSHNDKCTETSAVFQAAHSNVAASANENSAITTEATRTSCNFKESMLTKKQLIDIGGSDSGSADGPTRNHKANNPDTVDAVEDTENEMQAAKNIPRHAPIQILDGSLGACSQAFSTDVSHQESAFRQMRIPGHPTLFSNSAVSAAVESQNSTSRSTHDQMFPSFHPPLTPFPNSQEHYSSYLQMSSTLSSLIVSALLLNPAAHAAATFAASFWPSTNMERSTNCPGTNGGFPPQPINTAPSMAAIAAATVAAATAWWAAHGLLPMCAPPHAGFSCPVSVTAPSTNVAQATNQEREENNFQKTCPHDQPSDQELSDALQPQHSASKSSATSSSNSGNSSGAKMKIGLPDIDNEKKVPAVTEQKESSKGKGKKQVDRSSCGSNTPSGSDIETDALEKNDKTKEEAKEPDASHPANDISNRRNRVAGNMNDSWKEVSEGGRMAFQALFSREVLPQSFSPPHNIIRSMNKEKDVGIEENMQNAEESNENVSQLDLNNNTWESCSSGQDLEKNGFKENDGKDGLLTIGFQGKLKTRKTGFKPYKRCSVEGRECTVNSSSQDQGSCSKRLRLEGEAST